MASKKITWKTIKMKVEDLKVWDKNPIVITDSKLERLAGSITEFGYTNPILAQPDGTIIAGHQRRKALIDLGKKKESIEVRVPSRKLTKEEFEKLALGDNLWKGEFDVKQLEDQFNLDSLIDIGFERWMFGDSSGDLLSEQSSGGGSGSESGSGNKGSDTGKGSSKTQLQQGEKYLPFEVQLKVPTRKRFFDALKELKSSGKASDNQEAIVYLLDLFDKDHESW